MTVPIGVPSSAPISRAVRPRNAASSSARRCSSRQRRERGAQPLGLLAGDPPLLRRARGIDGVDEQLGRIDGLGPAQAGTVDRDVARDREQPGGHRPAPRVVRLGMPERAQERLLRGLLRLAAIAEDRQREPEHAALEPPHERSGGVGVTRPETGQ